MRRAWVLALGFAAGCQFQGTFHRQAALLRVEVDPPTAQVYLNDRYLGTARHLAEEPSEVQVGPNFVMIQAAGYFPHDLRVDLPPGETHINVRLRAIPP